jgi:hypothetical protein
MSAADAGAVFIHSVSIDISPTLWDYTPFEAAADRWQTLDPTTPMRCSVLANCDGVPSLCTAPHRPSPFHPAVDITSSFAVPFEEDPKEPTIFFLDHDYLDA